MSEYKIINDTPYGFDWENQNTRQLRAFETWFFLNKDTRLQELNSEFKKVCHKDLDFSIDSLKDVGIFMKSAITPRKLSIEEYNEKKNKYGGTIEISPYDISIKSRSLLIDIGIYFGEVFIRNHTKLTWSQCRCRSIRDANRGYMVIIMNNSPYLKEINPFRLMFVQGWKVLDGTFEENNLIKLYHIWNKDVREDELN